MRRGEGLADLVATALRREPGTHSATDGRVDPDVVADDGDRTVPARHPVDGHRRCRRLQQLPGADASVVRMVEDRTRETGSRGRPDGSEGPGCGSHINLNDQVRSDATGDHSSGRDQLATPGLGSERRNFSERPLWSLPGAQPRRDGNVTRCWRGSTRQRLSCRVQGCVDVVYASTPMRGGRSIPHTRSIGSYDEGRLT